ncbi:MAG: hypothetical protein AB1656_06160, partial [Candidatus Omnitrophota bacterium]
QQKNSELESAVARSEKEYAGSAFDGKKKELEEVFLPAIEEYNKALISLQTLGERHGYYPKVERNYSHYSVRDYEILKPAINDDDVREIVKRDYRESIKSRVERQKEEINRREMEIIEKILFAEDDEIAQMVRGFKEMKLEI